MYLLFILEDSSGNGWNVETFAEENDLANNI